MMIIIIVIFASLRNESLRNILTIIFKYQSAMMCWPITWISVHYVLF